MIDQPRVFMLCGLPFAGKSTLARRLVDQFGWTHIETDAINTERGLGLYGASIGSGDWIATYRVAHRRLEHALARGEIVVYDATNYRWAQRERVRQIAARHGATCHVIHIAPPQTEIARRREQNRRQPTRHHVRDEDWVMVADRFQPPTAAEAVLWYDGSTPFAVWVQHNLLEWLTHQR